MLVFTLPSFPYVFKVIRDHFAPPKDMDRQTVKDKYLLVKMHDRVGRMADTLEYSLVALPLDRFEPALLEELKDEAGSSIEFEGDQIVIRHVYIERRMQPLNLYLAEASATGDLPRMRAGAARVRQRDQGAGRRRHLPRRHAAEELRRHAPRAGRVLRLRRDRLLTECNFRRIPPPRTLEDEMSAEP